VFTETASGARTDRPTLTQLLDQLRPGDTLVVWKLDRLGRSLRHLVDTVTGLSGQYTMAAIAKTLGVSRASIYRHLKGDAS
jgi:DNA invertase Pin-like site-specific DNA recombinase